MRNKINRLFEDWPLNCFFFELGNCTVAATFSQQIEFGVLQTSLIGITASVVEGSGTRNVDFVQLQLNRVNNGHIAGKVHGSQREVVFGFFE